MKLLISACFLIVAVFLAGCAANNANVACTMEAKLCPDGSAVGRVPPNCDFAACPSNATMANPASVYCQEHGGTLQIVNEADGQRGICTLADGTKCDEWAYFRGECTTKYNVAEVTNDSCAIDVDCQTPGNYLIRSNCPYTSKCLDGKCAVVCPKFDAENQSYFQVKNCGPCPKYSAPASGWCSDGQIIPPVADECGCLGHPTCQKQVACTQEAKLCPDGTAVGRVGPNCEFAACPAEVQINCTEEQKNAQICTLEYLPVCGWFNESIKCFKYPCAATYGNACGACADAKVAYWTKGECPSG